MICFNCLPPIWHAYCNLSLRMKTIFKNIRKINGLALPIISATYCIYLNSPAEAKAEESTPRALQTALSETTISGYVDTSVIWKFGRGNGGTGVGNPISGGTMPGRAYDGTPKQDGINLNVVGITLNKPSGEDGWSAGYNVTLLFGPDAAGYNPSFGIGTSDFSLKDTYVELNAPVGNGLKFKIGTFTEPIGHEVFESFNNPNYSRSYGFFIEPTALTGILASYKFNESISAHLGVANSWLPGVNARAIRNGLPAGEWEKTYIAMIMLVAPESFGFLKGSTLNAGVIDGLAGGASDTTSFCVDGNVPTPIKKLRLGYAYDYRWTKSTGIAPSTHAYAAGLYFLYSATEKLNINTRVEYAKGTAGTWYAVNMPPNPFPESNPQNKLFGLTTTIDYSLWANVVTRLEFRWDHDLTGQHFSGPGDTNIGPFGDDDRNAFSLALNIVYKF